MNAIASDVAIGKTFINSSGRQTGTGGPAIPTFTVEWNSAHTEALSISCNKTFVECITLLNDSSNPVYVGAMVWRTVGSDESYTVPLYGWGDSIDDQLVCLYKDTYNPNQSIMFAEDGTISIYDLSNY